VLLIGPCVGPLQCHPWRTSVLVQLRGVAQVVSGLWMSAGMSAKYKLSSAGLAGRRRACDGQVDGEEGVIVSLSSFYLIAAGPVWPVPVFLFFLTGQEAARVAQTNLA